MARLVKTFLTTVSYNAQFKGQQLRSDTASLNKLIAVQGVKTIVDMQSQTPLLSPPAWSTEDTGIGEIGMQCKAGYPGKTLNPTKFPTPSWTSTLIPPLRRHREPCGLLTSWRSWEDGIGCRQGSRVPPPWRFTGQTHQWTEQQICTDVRCWLCNIPGDLRLLSADRDETCCLQYVCTFVHVHPEGEKSRALGAQSRQWFRGRAAHVGWVAARQVLVGWAWAN